MKTSKSNSYNENYSTDIVDVETFEKHPNPKCERLKVAIVGGYHVAVGIDTPSGKYLYFAVESQINPSFLAANNLFRHKELNNDPEATPGFFEDNGRVKAIKLQGEPSEGLIMPLEALKVWFNIIDKDIDINQIDGELSFDTIDGEWLSKKYVVPVRQHNNAGGHVKKLKKDLDVLIPTQFRFHYDTVLIRKTPWVIRPDSLISITSKIHGASAISAYVLCNKPIGKIKKKIYSMLGIPLTEYRHIYSSRKVVKSFHSDGGYYNEDIWKNADEVIQPKLEKGMTAYYEIVGYLRNGNYVQKDYDYGFKRPDGEYTEGINFGAFIYRLTYTNPDGIVHEFSAREVQQWCRENGLKAVKELYYGYAKDLYPDIEGDNYGLTYIDRLQTEKRFCMEQLSPDCNNKVPQEGIVIKIEDMRSRAWKLKCFKFLKKEQVDLDNNVEDIEEQ